MILFKKQGQMDKTIEQKCRNNISNDILQFYTIKVDDERIFVVDDSGVNYRDRIPEIKEMYLAQRN